MHTNDSQIYTCSLLQARASLQWIAVFKNARQRELKNTPLPADGVSPFHSISLSSTESSRGAGFWGWMVFASKPQALQG